ncbi:hypothetical protein [Pseudoxanthomonas mexicana]|uniref:hypothetical protein n=1 Tax=Pseudoxanthomonas mexicana TaxID=128785 RepID=UPI00398B1D98
MKAFGNPQRLLPVALVAVLAGCASTPPVAQKPSAAQPAEAPASLVHERDGRGAHRFHMHQDGRQMSADEFDAWMRARGIRVAKGAPAAPPAAAGRKKPVAARAPK